MKITANDFLKDFSHDCAECAALCCVVPKISDKEPGFNFNKAAFVPCPNLIQLTGEVIRLQCRVWDTLKSSGCAGCRKSDCFGVGNLITKLFRDLGLTETHAQPANMSDQEYNFLISNRNQLFALVSEALIEAANLAKKDAEEKGTITTAYKIRLAAINKALQQVQKLLRKNTSKQGIIPPHIFKQFVEEFENMMKSLLQTLKPKT